MSEIVRWSYIPYSLGHYWSKLVIIGILNRGTMISHKIKIEFPFGCVGKCDPAFSHAFSLDSKTRFLFVKNQFYK